MRALVVYESLFGNAERVARAVAAGIQRELPVEAVHCRNAPTVIDRDIALLVVGGPNHQFGMTKRSSREQAVREMGAPADCVEHGLRDWLADVTPPTHTLVAAAFDTQLQQPAFLHYADQAARREERLLRRVGVGSLVPAQHFYVMAPKGPIVDGELARAQAWGTSLAALCVAPAAGF